MAETEYINRCTNCGMNLGQSNPRQYCCKTHCPHATGEFFSPSPSPSPSPSQSGDEPEPEPQPQPQPEPEPQSEPEPEPEPEPQPEPEPEPEPQPEPEPEPQPEPQPEPEPVKTDTDSIAERLNAKFLEHNSDDKLRRILERKWPRKKKKRKFVTAGPPLEAAAPAPSVEDFKDIARKRLKTTVTVDDDEAKRIRDLPQHDPDGQANKEWLRSRKFRITGSHAAKAIGVQYTTLKKRESIEAQALQHLIWGISQKEQRKPALNYGNANEKEADAAFKAVMVHLNAEKKMEYEYPGLCVNRENPFLAMSPDGILTIDGEHHLIEYKCVWGLSGKSSWLRRAFIDEETNKLMAENLRTGEVQELRNLYETYDELKAKGKDTSGYGALPLEVKHRKLPIKLYYYTQVVHGKYTIDHRDIKTVYFVSWVGATSEKVTQLHPDEFETQKNGTQVQTGFAVWSTPHGTVQITQLKFEDDAATWSSQTVGQKPVVEKYYFREYFPLMLLKELGCEDHVPPRPK